MGYPRLLQLLIIEDETQMVETYKGCVQKLQKSRPLAQPCIVQSYTDAVEHLSRNDVFHLVILDLRLPGRVGSVADDASTRGLELVQRVASREHSPVPVLAIVTGDPKCIVNLGSLHRQLQERFWFGDIISKSMGLMEDLEKLIDKTLEYVDLGLIVCDPADELRPIITLRDEDLLRRAALSQTAAGLELSWWSSQRRDFDIPSSSPRWAKILQGRFVDRNDGLSRPHFFKLEPTDDGEQAYASAKRMESKLQHIKVVGHWKSSSASLLVTGKAGPSNNPPLSVGDILRLPPEEALPAVDYIAQDIATQLCCFTKSAKQEVPLRSLLWSPSGLDRRAQLADVARKWGVLPASPDPASVFSQLSASDKMVWVEKRRCHGDLHSGNVSLDRDGGSIRAFIIDAGVLEDVVCGRDLATLEVSLALHEDHTDDLLETKKAMALYGGTAPLGNSEESDDVPESLKVVLALVTAVRQQALVECNPDIYAVLLTDQVMIQLGGLAFGSTRNKIRRPIDAFRLFGLLAQWLQLNGTITA